MTSCCLGPTVQESWKSIVWFEAESKGLGRPSRAGAEPMYCLKTHLVKLLRAVKSSIFHIEMHRNRPK